MRNSKLFCEGHTRENPHNFHCTGLEVGEEYPYGMFAPIWSSCKKKKTIIKKKTLLKVKTNCLETVDSYPSTTFRAIRLST